MDGLAKLIAMCFIQSLPNLKQMFFQLRKWKTAKHSHKYPQGRIQAWSLGRATKKETWGYGGHAPRKIFLGHALQTLGKRGKRPFYFILDHEAYHLIFIIPDIQTGIFVQNVMGDQLGK